MFTIQHDTPKYHIQPYHMNGLNWRLVPDDPDRDNIVIVTGFTPPWWTEEYGITFRSDFHLDLAVHRATLARMESILQERFGNLPNFFCGDDYANADPMERRYGDALIPALFDAQVSFDNVSGHPFAASLDLTAGQVEGLGVPDIAHHPVTQLLLHPHEDGEWCTAGELGFEGVINIAYNLRSQDLFLDMIDSPERTRHLYDVVWQTINDFVHLVRAWQDPAGMRPTYFVSCDCVVNMVSGEMYHQQLLEFDRRFYNSFDLYGVHTCNWTIDPYLDSLAEMSKLAYLDMGPGTDIDRVHKLFPDLCPSVFVHPQWLREASEQKIAREITELGKRIGRGYILLSDLEIGTRDSQIRAAYEAAARL